MTLGAPVLLDTHVFIWALAEPARVPEAAWALLRDPGQPLVLSVVSAWELALKVGTGKLMLPDRVDAFVAAGCRRTETRVLDLRLSHVAALAELPWHHRDPFDRMLVAQAQAEGIALLSYDRALDAYDVARVG